MLTQELIDWLRLILIPEIGSRRGKSLLAKFKTPKAILEAPLDAIAEVENIGREVALKIVESRENVPLDQQIKLIKKNDVTLIPLDSSAYPDSLKSIFDPPLVLFVKGEILEQDYFSLAIVGTRLASFYGRVMSEKLSRELVEKGFTIVSGGARGIDTFSHQAVLKAKGRTLAVLGCGLDIAYPSENEKLFAEIAKSGAMISEFPLSTAPDRQNFPMRNRIISGLSLGVVVIEAPRKSGALITVTHANEQGREVFSVPGRADSFLSSGTNQLLKEGAKLVENADDIIEELELLLKSKINELKVNWPKDNGEASDRGRNARGNVETQVGSTDSQSHQPEGNGLASDRGRNARGNVEARLGSTFSQSHQPEPVSENEILNFPRLTAEEDRVYNLLSQGALELDDLIVQSQLSVSIVSSTLTMLQLKKLVKQSPGKIFEKV